MPAAAVRVTISVVSGSLALCFNSLSTFIILTTKCSYIGRYKYLLLAYTVTAAIYSLGQLATATSFLVLPDGYMFYDSVRLLPNTVSLVAINIYMATFVQNIVILTLSFIYRYFAICRPQGLEIFLANWIKITIGSGLITASVVGALVYALLPSPECEEVFGDGFHRITGYNITDTAYSGGITFYHGHFNWILFIALGSCSILIFASTGIILVLALRTAKKLKVMSLESQTMANQQKKIFTLLIFQIVLPLVSNMVPIQIVLISAYFQLPVDLLVENIGCILTIAQIIDPLLTFYYIKPYRRALCKKPFHARVSSGGDSVTDQHQQRTSPTNGHSAPL